MQNQIYENLRPMTLTFDPKINRGFGLWSKKHTCLGAIYSFGVIIKHIGKEFYLGNEPFINKVKRGLF